MQFAPFVHLHAHSDYSLLAGTMPVKSLLNKAVEMRQPAVALTDYGNLFGAVEFYSQAMKLGIKPILGCEVYICDNMSERVSDGPRGPKLSQLVLLARNNHGWQNLLKLVSAAYLEGFYYKPRIDKALLARHADGLIALSAGWNGEVEQALQRGDKPKAKALAAEYRDIFRENCYFLELQRTGAAGQEQVNRAVIDIAHELDIPLVASNNAHFLAREDFRAFEAMQALQQNRTLQDDVSGHFNPECYLKSHEEMQELFEDVPEAIENTVHIANRCNVDLQFGHYQLPDFKVPEGMDLKDFIREKAAEGLDARWPAILAGRPEAPREEYEKRLAFELDVIEKMGFPGYFLIVSDFIMWAKHHDIPVGPGRGSGAGSLVAYCLGITDLDPIRYGLLFERFLNPERVSMPDFDVDFCMSRRDEVIRYVTEKYGEERVAQIITYGSMKAKAVVRDVGRVLAMPLPRVDEIAKLIPNDLDITLEKAIVAEPKLAAMLEQDDDVKQLFEIALKLEGRNRHAGKHAAGVIIGRTPLVEIAPLYKDPREDGKVVQWDMKNAEKVGLIKFDFLGLKTLTVLQLAVELIRRGADLGTEKGEAEKKFDLATIPLDDARTYDLLKRGDTGAVFQLESSGMRDLLRRMRPDCFEDIIALVALYRPGPLQSGMVDDFIERKHGKQQVVYPVPQLEPILAETYGVILYQEQVMKIAQDLAGYTLGQADLLRRAMGKKNPAEMAQQRQIFMEGSAKNKIPDSKAEHIFDLMEKFAGYGFNKSHSAAYALIAYQTAYLKAHFPQAFMAATLSCDMGNSDKVARLVADCQSMGIAMLPPHINASDWEFMPEDDAIRFGLGAVKGVGEAAIREMVRVRREDGNFTDFEDLMLRAPDRTMNKRILEALIKGGALQGLIPHPHAALEGLSDALEKLTRRRKEQGTRQSALFEVAEPGAEHLFPELKPWNASESLRAEREVLGFYLTGHPLEAFIGRVSGLGDCDLGRLPEMEDGARIVVPIGVSSLRQHHGARGTMAFVQIEDLNGQAEMLCFAKVYAASSEALKADKPLLVAGRVDKSKDEPVLIAESIAILEEILSELVDEVRISAASIAWDEVTLARLKGECEAQGASARLAFHVTLPDGSVAHLHTKPCLHWDAKLKAQLEARFGAEAMHLHCRPWQPPREQNARRG